MNRSYAKICAQAHARVGILHEVGFGQGRDEKISCQMGPFVSSVSFVN